MNVSPEWHITRDHKTKKKKKSIYQYKYGLFEFQHLMRDGFEICMSEGVKEVKQRVYCVLCP